MAEDKEKTDLSGNQASAQTQACSISVQKFAYFAAFLLIITIVPAFLHTQWFTGPLVNAILILTCALVGPMEAVLLGLVPSSVALSSGLLPLPLAPMVPFIMMGNAIFIAAFYYLKSINNWFALGVASVLKFTFLLATVKFLMANLLEQKLVANLAIMMSWPQLITALIGGAIALALLKASKSIRIS